MTGVDMSPHQAAMEIVVRDKNQALDQLDKVRGGSRGKWCNKIQQKQGVLPVAAAR